MEENEAAVLIALSGVTVSPMATLDVLTGQQVTASLQVGNCTINSYSWKTVAGDAFKNYDPTLPSNQLVPLAAADETAPSFSFYTMSDKENATVSCTATITCPDGTTGTVKAQLALTSVKPTATVKVNDPD